MGSKVARRLLAACTGAVLGAVLATSSVVDARPSDSMCATFSLDTTLAIEPLLEACARQGNANAQYVLGMQYWGAWYATDMSSYGVPVETSRDEVGRLGTHWLQRAASQGLPEAQNELGYGALHAIGRDGPDYAEALHWLEAASHQGDQIAAFNLARMHLFGLGVPPSAQQGARYLWLSIDHDYRPALCSMDVLVRRGQILLNAEEALRLDRLKEVRLADSPCDERSDLMEELTPRPKGG